LGRFKGPGGVIPANNYYERETRVEREFEERGTNALAVYLLFERKRPVLTVFWALRISPASMSGCTKIRDPCPAYCFGRLNEIISPGRGGLAKAATRRLNLVGLARTVIKLGA
jgi:hypothetical protein